MPDIRRYIGLPYKDKGADFDGVDCLGLCILFNRVELGKTIPPHHEYYTSADDFDEAVNGFEEGKKGWRKTDDDPQIGDTILFRQMGYVSHAGLYISNREFLHSVAGQASCLVRLDDFNWAKRKDGIMRWG